MKSLELSRTFTGGLDDLGLLHDWLDTLAGEAFAVNATTVLRIRQILAEGFSNAVLHAHRGEVGRPVEVRMVYQPQIDPLLRLEVKDTGAGFELPPPREPHEHAERGRGFLILRALAERVEYHDNTLRVWLRPAVDKS
jgi:anti-sigma regulatory factor (Ser/Thr protein kinase)